VPWMLYHHHRLLPRTNRRHLRRLLDCSLPANRRQGPFDRGLLIPKKVDHSFRATFHSTSSTRFFAFNEGVGPRSCSRRAYLTDRRWTLPKNSSRDSGINTKRAFWDSGYSESNEKRFTKTMTVAFYFSFLVYVVGCAIRTR